MTLLSGRQLVGKIQQEIKQCTCEDVDKASKTKDQVIIIDIREPAEVVLGMIPGSIHIPRGVLEMEITSHPLLKSKQKPLSQLASQEVYLYCRSGARSALAAKSLEAMGLSQVWSMAGGFNEWQAQKRPIISSQHTKVWELDGLFAWEEGGGI